MHIHHSRDCRHSPLFPHCNCGAAETQERLDQLEAEREAIERLIENAETIILDGTRAPYTPKMVMASDLVDVLSGKMR